MNRTVLLIAFLAFIVMIICIDNVDLKSDSVKTTIDIFTTIGSAVLGGYVAYYSAYIQVEGNKKLENYKEQKLSKNICILVINDLRDITIRLRTILKFDISKLSHKDLKPYINIDSLEKFKTDFIHILEDDADVLTYSSVLNRLLILKSTADDAPLERGKLDQLITDIQKVDGFVSANLETIKSKINIYLNSNDTEKIG